MAKLWPPMLWIGGAQGAGKSTLAWNLSRTWDLPLHPVDLWAYDHQARLPPGQSLDEQQARGAEAAADAFEAVSRARLDLVLADIAARDLGPVPALVEGPQLTPELAARLPDGASVWLLPDPERTRQARQERLARQDKLAAGIQDPTQAAAHPTQAAARPTQAAARPTQAAARRARTEALLRRDAILAVRIRQAATSTGRPVIEVPATPDWPAIKARIEAALAPALRAAPRLHEGLALTTQRRHENATAARQGRLWAQDAGLATPPSYPFACECGTSRCRATWRATPGQYAARAASQLMDLHIGGEHR